jgi:hypothetical protein
MVPHRISQSGGQYLPQPDYQFLFGGSTELAKVTVGFEKRFLDQVRGIEPGLESAINLQPSQ